MGAVADDGEDVRFHNAADALRWLEAEEASRKQVDQVATDQLAALALRIEELKRAGMAAMSTKPLGAELVVEVRDHYVEVNFSIFEDAMVFPRYRATTKALRALEMESASFATRFRIPLGRATAAIMTGVLPEARGRSLLDDRLDILLQDVLREMKEQGMSVPGAGHPGRDSGVKDFWEEVMKHFNKAVAAVPELKERRAGHWTTVRSRFKAMCERDPQFREEIGGSDEREAKTEGQR